LNEGLEAGLTARGLVFNRPGAAPFQEVLRTAGFYRDWKRKFGADAWGVARAGRRRPARLTGGFG